MLSNENKVSKYRMWKSGKQWLFGASLVAASVVAFNTQAFAEESSQILSETPSALVTAPPTVTEEIATEPVAKDTEIVVPTASAPVGPKYDPNASKDEEEKAKNYSSDNTWNDYSTETEFQNTQPVTIHYESKSSDDSYAAWIWKDSKENDKGRWENLSKEGNKHTLKVNAEQGISSFDYIIVKNADTSDSKTFGNQNDGKKVTGDMTAPVSVYTPTDIYHNENDGWYS